MIARRHLVGTLVLVACTRTKATSYDSAPDGGASGPTQVPVEIDASSKGLEPDASIPDAGEGVDANAPPAGARKAILDGLRAEVQRQYAGSKTLGSAELVFAVKNLRYDEKLAYVYAEVLRKAGPTGNVKIAMKDFDGTKFERLAREGLFDGPTVIAILAKEESGWRVARFPKGDSKGQLAMALGPTDFPGDYYLETFGLAPSWGR